MLKFATEDQALQHLSDLTGKRIKIAELDNDIWDKINPDGQYIWKINKEYGTDHLEKVQLEAIREDPSTVDIRWHIVNYPSNVNWTPKALELAKKLKNKQEPAMA